LPRNGIDLIRRVIARFGLDAGQYLTIIPNSGSHTHLPIDEPAPLLGVLASCVELQDVATRDDIATLGDHCDDPPQQAALRALADDYAGQVLAPNRSLLDLLEAFPACDVPFAEYLDMLPPLRPRYYSISSSPMTDSAVCSITVGVLRGPARSGTGTFTGVGSGHLAALPDEGTVFAFVRSPSIAFRPPENPHTPMIMVGAGTGLAPFRGFLQERAALKGQGVPVERSLLFFGCRDRDADYLYADELREWEAGGVVRLECAFSRTAGTPSRYVQDAMLESADEVWDLLQHDAAVFVCGNAATMAPAVRSALMTIFRDKTTAGEADAAAWLAGLRASGFDHTGRGPERDPHAGGEIDAAQGLDADVGSLRPLACSGEPGVRRKIAEPDHVGCLGVSDDLGADLPEVVAPSAQMVREEAAPNVQSNGMPLPTGVERQNQQRVAPCGRFVTLPAHRRDRLAVGLDEDLSAASAPDEQIEQMAECVTPFPLTDPAALGIGQTFREGADEEVTEEARKDGPVGPRKRMVRRRVRRVGGIEDEQWAFAIQIDSLLPAEYLVLPHPPTLERMPYQQQVEQQDAQRIQVCRDARLRLPPNDLRRHELVRAADTDAALLVDRDIVVVTDQHLAGGRVDEHIAETDVAIAEPVRVE
jgi:ferredoxin-NADP reductase